MRFERNAPPGPLALIVSQLFGEPKEPLGARDLEPIRERACRLAHPIAHVPLTREPLISPGGDLARDDLVRVAVDLVHVSSSTSMFVIAYFGTSTVSPGCSVRQRPASRVASIARMR